MPTVERDPALRWRPLSEDATQPFIRPYQWIVHTAVDGPGPTNLGDYFENHTALESHTWLRWTFHEQFIGFDRSADANYLANRWFAGGEWRGAISTETEDDGTPVERPWNAYQLGELIRFGVWLNKTFGIPAVVPATPTSPGMGWHALHPHDWTNVAGKTCPGSTRIHQFLTIVLPGIQAAIKGDTMSGIAPFLIQAPGSPVYITDLVTTEKVPNPAGLGFITANLKRLGHPTNIAPIPTAVLESMLAQSADTKVVVPTAAQVAAAVKAAMPGAGPAGVDTDALGAAIAADLADRLKA
jgi:hypothetical protein